MKFLQSKGTITFTLFFILLCLVYPIYFMADDWEHIYHYLTNHHWEYVKHWVFRNPTSVFLIYFIFPLYIKKYFIFSKFLLWGSLIFSSFLILKIFVVNFKEKFNKNYLWGLVPIVLAFPPNNYEWNFWPVVSVLLLVFPFMVGIFYLQHINKNKKYNLVIAVFKIIFYTIAFFGFESLLSLFVLMELSYIFYVDSNYKDKNLFIQLLEITKRVLPSVVICFALKIFLQNIYSYPYVSKIGFKWHLFSQFLNISFNHDYYKTRWLTGSIQMVSLIYLLVLRLKSTSIKNFLKKDLIILIVYVVSATYYFYVMDYSSRRAVGGQLYFLWAFFTLAVLNIFYQSRKKTLLILFFVPYLFHQSYIFQIKYNDRENYLKNGLSFQKKVEESPKVDKVKITRIDAISNIKTGWNVVIPDHLHGFYLYFLPIELQQRVEIDW